MTSLLFVAVLSGVCGMLGWGIADLCAKKTIDQIGENASLVLAHLCGSVVLVSLCLYLYTGGVRVALPDSMLFGLYSMFGIAQAGVYILAYRAFRQGPIAVMGTIFSTFAVWAAVASVVFLGESVSWSSALGLFCVVGGVFAMSIDTSWVMHPKKMVRAFASRAGMWEVCAATLVAALWTLGWDTSVSAHEWLIPTTTMYCTMTLTLFIYAAWHRTTYTVYTRSLWVLLVMIGIAEVVAYAGLTWGYARTPHTSIIAVISSASALPVLVGARLWLGERLTLSQTFGALLVIVGTMCVIYTT